MSSCVLAAESFNRDAFERLLVEARIAYVYLGNELGGRIDDPSWYDDGRVQYDRVAKTAKFAEGMARLEKGVAEHRVSLMCAEKDPLRCHRTLLVAREAHERGWVVHHILEDGRLESHDEVIARVRARVRARRRRPRTLRPQQPDFGT